MLAKLFGDTHKLLLSHIVYKFPLTRFSFRELNVFQGGWSDDWHWFCFFDFIGKGNPKVGEHKSQEGCIGQWGRTPDRSDFRHCPKNIPSKVDWLSIHEQVDQFKGLGVGVVSGVRLW